MLLKSPKKNPKHLESWLKTLSSSPSSSGCCWVAFQQDTKRQTGPNRLNSLSISACLGTAADYNCRVASLERLIGFQSCWNSLSEIPSNKQQPEWLQPLPLTLCFLFLFLFLLLRLLLLLLLLLLEFDACLFNDQLPFWESLVSPEWDMRKDANDAQRRLFSIFSFLSCCW